MNEVASLVIKVDSSGADRATRSLDHLDRASGKTERAAHKLGAAFGKAIGGLLTGYATQRVVREYIRAADAMANMSARIGLVTNSEKELIATRKALFGLSQRTASDMEATADLYVKMAQSSEELRNNQDALLTVTEAVSKALVVSGADAASSSAVIRQFSQALASGALRGDEFVSVMEGAPRLARAIADGLGVPIGKLRELAAQGELTAEKIVAAVRSQSEVLDSEFGKMPLTVGRAVDKVQNSLLLLIGKADESSEASQGLAQSISDMADVLSSEETQKGFGEVVSGLVSVATVAVQATSKIGEFIGKYKEFLANQGAVEGNTPEQLEARRDKLVQFRGTMRGRLFNHDGAIDREITQVDNRIEEMARQAKWGNVTGGSSTTETFGGTATAGLKDKTKATKELTEAQKAWLQMEDEIAAHEEVATTALRDATNARLQKIIDEEDAIERQRQATAGLIADMEFERSLIGMTNIEREKAIALHWAGVDATSAAGQKIAELAESTAELREAQQIVDDLEMTTVDFAVSAAMNLGRAGDAFDNFADRLKRIALQMLAEKAIQWLFGAMFGGGNLASGSTVGNGDTAFGFSSYGGGRASGGPVMAGQSYLVGEKGRPEIFTPGTSGSISQAAPAAKGGNMYVTVENNSGAQARTERSTGPDGSQFLKVIIEQTKGAVTDDILRGGSTHRAIAGTFGLSRSGRPVSG